MARSTSRGSREEISCRKSIATRQLFYAKHLIHLRAFSNLVSSKKLSHRELRPDSIPSSSGCFEDLGDHIVDEMRKQMLSSSVWKISLRILRADFVPWRYCVVIYRFAAEKAKLTMPNMKAALCSEIHSGQSQRPPLPRTAIASLSHLSFVIAVSFPQCSMRFPIWASSCSD